MRRCVSFMAVVVLTGCGADKPVTKAPVVSARSLTLSCEPHAVQAFDSSRQLMLGRTLPCLAQLADREGAPVVGVTPTLLSEAGLLLGSASGADGLVRLLHKPALPLPLDVAPGTFSATPVVDDTHTGALLAPLWMEPKHWVENPLTLMGVDVTKRAWTLKEPRRPDPLRVSSAGQPLMNNPRDNLVTLVLVVDGEEAFTDVNGNGHYDVGEPFEDLTEPFVDADDDGTWTEGEAFVDLNGDRSWNGKNGAWDAATKLWVQERVLWTGAPAPEDALATVTGMPLQVPTMAVQPGRVELRCGPTVGVGEPCYRARDGASTITPPPDFATFTIFLADPWFNALSLAGAPSCAIDPASVPANSVTFRRVKANTLLDWSVDVLDARDPNLPAIQQVPKRGVPVPVDARFGCEFGPELKLVVSLPVSVD